MRTDSAKTRKLTVGQAVGGETFKREANLIWKTKTKNRKVQKIKVPSNSEVDGVELGWKHQDELKVLFFASSPGGQMTISTPPRKIQEAFSLEQLKERDSGTGEHMGQSEERRWGATLTTEGLSESLHPEHCDQPALPQQAPGMLENWLVP